MKNKFLLLGAAVLAAATLNVGAYNLAQSPRAAGNQIKLAQSAPASEVAVATTATVAPSARVAQSPRAADNQIKVAATGAADSLTFTSCKLIGSPKAIAEAGRNARMSCCGQTLADCSMVATCGK